MRKTLLAYFFKNQVLAAIVVVALVWLAIQIREVLIAIFVAYIIMASISPYATYLEKKRVPRTLSVAIPYLVTVVGLFVVIISILPFLILQIQLLITSFPTYINREAALLGLKFDSSQFGSIATSEIENIGRGALSITGRVFGGIFSIVSTFVISFYFLYYRDILRKNFASLFPKASQNKVASAIIQAEDKLGNWLRGQVVLSGFIGLASWIFLSILGIDFALPLAAVAGLLEIVPTIGPTIAAIPAVIVASTISLPMAALVVGVYILIQFFESHFLVPRVMQKAVGLNPIVVIIGIIAGGKLLGPIGALLAVPFLSLLVVVYKNLD